MVSIVISASLGFICAKLKVLLFVNGWLIVPGLDVLPLGLYVGKRLGPK